MIQSRAVTGGSRRLPSATNWTRSRGQPGGPGRGERPPPRPERRGSSPRSAPARRRRARSQRLIAVLALCGVAFVVGLVAGARHTPAGQAHAERFAAAWERGDYAAMYSELTAGDRDRLPARALHRRLRGGAAHRHRRRRSTRPSRARTAAPTASPVRIPTRAFGTVAGEVVLPATGDGHRLVARARLPGARRRRAPAPRDADARRARRCWPATAPCWPRATTAPRRRCWRRRSSASSARSRPSAARSSPRSACPPTPRSASPASSGSSTSACSARPAASSSPARACSSAPVRTRPRPCARRSRCPSSRRRSPRSARASAASWRSSRARARCSPSPASPSRACSRRARRSR